MGIPEAVFSEHRNKITYTIHTFYHNIIKTKSLKYQDITGTMRRIGQEIGFGYTTKISRRIREDITGRPQGS